jgi:hypothetical protein
VVQRPSPTLDTLPAAGCEAIFEERAWGRAALTAHPADSILSPTRRSFVAVAGSLLLPQGLSCLPHLARPRPVLLRTILAERPGGLIRSR